MTDPRSGVRRDRSAAATDGSPKTVADGSHETAADGSREAATDGGCETATAIDVERDAASGAWYRQALVVAETEYRLAVRGRWAVALTAIFAAFSLGLTTFSGSSVSPQGYERIVASLAVLAVYLVPLVALAFSYDAIVGREESGWLHALFALPVDRAWLVVGTALGRAVVLSSATLIGFGVAGVLLVREYGLAGADASVAVLLATVGLALAFLAVGVLVSTLAREKAHALGASLLVWAWFVLVHDLLGLGLVAAFDLPGAAVAAMVLANPTGVFRALVLGSLGAGGDAGFAAVLAGTGLSTGVLVVALLAWIVLPTALAAVAIRRRRV